MPTINNLTIHISTRHFGKNADFACKKIYIYNIIFVSCGEKILIGGNIYYISPKIQLICS